MDHRSTKHPRGRVNEMQEMCLQLHKPFLMDELDTVEIVHRLRSKFVFNENDENFILKDGIRRNKNGRLVDTLINRTSRGFEDFMQVLLDTGHDAAHSRLLQTLEEWKEGKEAVKQKKVPLPVVGVSSLPDNVEELDGLRGQVDNLSERVEGISMRLIVVEEDQNDDVVRRENDLKEAKAEIRRLRAENERLAALFTGKSKELEQAKKQIKMLEQRVMEMEAKNEDLKTKIREQSKKMKQMNDKISSLEQDVEANSTQHDHMKKQLERQEKDAKQHSKEMDDLRHKQQEEHKELHEATRLLKEQVSKILNAREGGPTGAGRETGPDNRKNYTFPPLPTKTTKRTFKK